LVDLKSITQKNLVDPCRSNFKVFALGRQEDIAKLNLTEGEFLNWISDIKIIELEPIDDSIETYNIQFTIKVLNLVLDEMEKIINLILSPPYSLKCCLFSTNLSLLQNYISFNESLQIFIAKKANVYHQTILRCPIFQKSFLVDPFGL